MRVVGRFLILFAMIACANLATAQQTESFSRVSIPETEVRYLRSSIVGDTFEISIALPNNYYSKDTTYPVLYMTDANMCFPLTVQSARVMEQPGMEELPDIIIVGIGYRSLAQWGRLRFRDLTPTRIPEYSLSGGAPLFFRFIKEELIPFIKKNYKVSNDAAYEGYSYGGEFGLYVLFNEPELFHRYIIGSPWLPHDNFVMLKYESDYASTHRDLSAIVFMSVGELEETAGTVTEIGQVSDMKLLSERLLQRHYPSFMLETKVFEGETHLSAGPATISRGLRVIYRK
ncbi:MAG TPA: alpha/beta hydrolase-fold protein [Candidatus Kryptonia bacterium]